MKAPHCCYICSLLIPVSLLLLPALSGPMAVLLAAEAAPGPGPPNPVLRTLTPLPLGSTASQPPGRAPVDVTGPRGAEGGNGSTPRAGLVGEDHAEKASEGSAVSGGLAVSPNPSDKPMTQRALTVLMVVTGAVLVYFVVRTVRMRRRNRKTRRYGVLDTNIENMELTPLEQDDEDEDNTLFDANHPRR
ncbi:PREDICTED: membrane protein FAM174A-like [Elephantulus edwardii]|uniref:membrane protein FAM174A-like n=1 Tax=Elephantulus edwardii TaxID=28737 RepID=UPI0003F084DD|nr:PREDICTED: membrane protein FAM174A-like [Elephantulus edwardii]